MSGIVGVVREKDLKASNLILYGLYALQHRGQANAGIGMIDGNEMVIKKGTGQVTSVFRDDVEFSLPGSRGIGHVKYGEYKDFDKEQPILPNQYEIKGQKCLIALDGNIHNSDFSIYEMTKSMTGSISGIKDYLKGLRGAFGGIYLDRYKMIGFRDPWGFKPICVGKIDDGFIIASETCAIDSCGGILIKMLEKGEMVVIKNGKAEFFKYHDMPKKSCLFEMIYVSRPDSYMDSVSIYKSRNNMGKILFEENPTDADIVMGAPDSGLIAAIGYAEASKIPYKDGIIKNRYVGRTFITPDDDTRTKDIFIKLNPIKEVLKDKKVILVDDSIVRSSTIKRTVKMLKEAGAKEVHVRISAPMVKYTCNLSLDLPDKDSLIASKMDVEQIRERIGADSLYYISLEGLKRACEDMEVCDHCFTGNYPI
ncbi:MAG: amidophosphoribosyltransferase [Tissierellia bacterium]|nr:amidophosphoribosyltransferase [Tissierellia bacterium]